MEINVKKIIAREGLIILILSIWWVAFGIVSTEMKNYQLHLQGMDARMYGFVKETKADTYFNSLSFEQKNEVIRKGKLKISKEFVAAFNEKRAKEKRIAQLGRLFQGLQAIILTGYLLSQLLRFVVWAIKTLRTK